jgi:hypothetical protein
MCCAYIYSVYLQTVQLSIPKPKTLNPTYFGYCEAAATRFVLSQRPYEHVQVTQSLGCYRRVLELSITFPPQSHRQLRSVRCLGCRSSYHSDCFGETLDERDDVFCHAVLRF